MYIMTIVFTDPQKVSTCVFMYLTMSCLCNFVSTLDFPLHHGDTKTNKENKHK